MGQSFTSLHYHIVFSTRGRTPMIKPVIQPRLYEYIGGILRAQKGTLIRAGGMADHVHLLVRLHAQASVSNSIRDIKANSSGWIHDTFPAFESFGWQTGYAAFSVSFSSIPDVRKYIEMQEAHHGGMDFKREMILLLEKHEIEYDPRYIFE